MSTPVQPQPPTPAGATSHSSVPGVGTAPESPPAEFRFGAAAPAWAQGKSAQEVLGIASQLNEALRGYVQTGTPATPAPVTAPPAGIGDQDYVTGADFRREAGRFVNESVNPQLQRLVEMSAQNALTSVKRDNAAIFQKYEPEINQYLSKIPKDMWNVDNLGEIVTLVKGRHVDEYAREHAGRLVAEMGPTLRSNGAPAAPPTQQEQKLTLQSDAIPADWKKRAQEAGLTEATVDEFCRAANMTRESFFGTLGKTAITEAPRR